MLRVGFLAPSPTPPSPPPPLTWNMCSTMSAASSRGMRSCSCFSSTADSSHQCSSVLQGAGQASGISRPEHRSRHSTRDQNSTSQLPFPPTVADTAASLLPKGHALPSALQPASAPLLPLGPDTHGCSLVAAPL